MNERIKQLWEDNDTIEVCYPEQGSPVSVSATTLEKFAELIVRECMRCADFVGITNDRIGLGPMPIRYTSMVNDQIKKHFGVEE